MRHELKSNSGPEIHVSDDLLVKHADGELPEREIDQVDAHLKYCWSCRTRRDRIEQAIADVVQYQDRQLKPYLPPTPGGRSMFLARLDQLASLEARKPWWRRTLSFGTTVRSWRISPATAGLAIAACLILTVLILVPKSPGISAAELLQRARSAEIQSLGSVVQPVVFQKLRIRAGGHSVTRTIYRDTASRRRKDQLVVDQGIPPAVASSGKTALPANVSVDLKQVENTLEQAFVAANLDWQDPLSVPTYQSWRDGLQQREEDVTAEGDEFQLTTSTSEGPITEARLRIRARDYHVVAESVRLRDDRQIEIAELEYQLIPAGMAASIFPAEPSPANAAPIPQPVVVAPPPLAPGAAELADAEVDALVALHAIGADLGEPVEIVRTSAIIEARGLADTAERMEQLRAALEDVPYLAFRIQTVAEASASIGAKGAADKAAEAQSVVKATGQGSATGAVMAGKPPLDDYLTRYFASRKSNETPAAKSGQTAPDSIQREVQGLSRQAIALSEKAMSRAWALRRLARRYPPEELEKLSPKARGELENIIRDHVRALKEELAGSRTLLMPVLESIPRATADGRVSHLPVKDLGTGWPAFPTALFDLVNYVDRITNGLLAGAEFPLDLEVPPAGKYPLRIKSPEEHAADLVFLYQLLDQQLPRLEASIAGSFLGKSE